MDARSLLAWNLRQLRTDRQISQERLAADSGVDRAYVSQIERGLFAASVDVMDRLAAALEVEVGRLLVRPPDDAPSPSNLRKGRKTG